MNWEEIANQVQEETSTFVDWEERFFFCPECGEPLYEADWEAKDFLKIGKTIYCPICENVIACE